MEFGKFSRTMRWQKLPMLKLGSKPESGPLQRTALKMIVPSTAEETICKKNDHEGKKVLSENWKEDHHLGISTKEIVLDVNWSTAEEEIQANMASCILKFLSYGKQAPKKARENNYAPIIEDWVSDDEDDVESIPKVDKKTVIHTATKKEFV
ncbi:hypothetical protein Tco_0185988 [Tanacetum coccineum]